LHRDELDLGWWVLRGMQICGLAWGLKTPANLPHRPSLQSLTKEQP
jgi:hypothetical protein